MVEERSRRPDLSRPRRVHLVGAGGAGMSAIAAVLAGMGHRVSGSDRAASPALDRLGALGVATSVGHDPAHVGDAEVVAVSTAIPEGDPEVLEAQHRGVRVWRRSELLGAICATRRTVAVAGTHGKTTTSAMLTVVLRHAGWHPSFVVGGDIVGLSDGAGWDPEGEWLVVEADESDGTFLELPAEVAVVTSVEADHLEHYGDEAGLHRAFVAFVDAASGPRVVCADDPGAAALAGAGRVTSYGTRAGSAVALLDVELGRGAARFVARDTAGAGGSAELAVPGLHNVRNAGGALAAARAIGVPWDVALAGVSAYRGVGRRFEWRGERDGVTFVDDYGHLPAEVAATLAAARDGGWARVVAVFQPHRYSRTAALWSAFADAFDGADVLMVTDIYPAGEAPRPGVTGALVAGAVVAAHPEADVRYVPRLGDVVTALRAELRPGDLCLTLGAGDLNALPGRLLGTRGPGG